MASGLNHLPDFSKGEGRSHGVPQDFQPLFGTPDEQPDWQESPSGADNDDSCDDLAMLVSELGQPVAEEVEFVTEEVQASVPLDEHEAALQQIEQRHNGELEQLRADHESQVLEQLERLQDGMASDVVPRLELMIATSLKTLFQDKIAQDSIEQLVGEITSTVKSESVERIQLVGPQVMADAVSKALAKASLHIDIEELDSPDLIVHVNEQILSTRIADWTAKIEVALAV